MADAPDSSAERRAVAVFLAVDVAEVRTDEPLPAQGVDVPGLCSVFEMAFDIKLADEVMAKIGTLDELVRAVESAPRRQPPAPIRWSSN